MGTHQQRVVGIAEDGDVGHGQRADGLAVVAVAQAHELALVAVAEVAPAVEALLERDLDRTRAIAAEEDVPQRATGARAQAFTEADGGLVRAAGQHHVWQGVELLLDGGIDAGIRVAEEVDPPGAVGVEIAVAVEVDEPGPLAPRDGQRRHALGTRHLRAGMPHRIKAAALQGGGGAVVSHGPASCEPRGLGLVQETLYALAPFGGGADVGDAARCRRAAAA